MDLKPGDIVYLKTGSPLMVVKAIIDAETVCCSWFDASLSYSHEAEFNIAQLERHYQKPELQLID
jgi:uncharacterized protein YodC (DUF2158 family)